MTERALHDQEHEQLQCDLDRARERGPKVGPEEEGRGVEGDDERDFDGEVDAQSEVGGMGRRGGQEVSFHVSGLEP